MRKEGQEDIKARREICQFSKNLIKGNRDGSLREDKNLLRLLVQKTKQRTFRAAGARLGEK